MSQEILYSDELFRFRDDLLHLEDSLSQTHQEMQHGLEWSRLLHLHFLDQLSEVRSTITEVLGLLARDSLTLDEILV